MKQKSINPEKDVFKDNQSQIDTTKLYSNHINKFI